MAANFTKLKLPSKVVNWWENKAKDWSTERLMFTNWDCSWAGSVGSLILKRCRSRSKGLLERVDVVSGRTGLGVV